MFFIFSIDNRSYCLAVSICRQYIVLNHFDVIKKLRYCYTLKAVKKIGIKFTFTMTSKSLSYEWRINLIPDISHGLSWLKAHPKALQGIRRGIEREVLRVIPNGTIALTRHPEHFGSSLTHKWITTDFAEAQLEFITPVNENIDNLLVSLRDIHRYVARHLGQERMWPFSMPSFIVAEKSIELAQFGSSNIGRMKTLYRQGLKNRYGSMMQTISGVHYNFSLPLLFWQLWADAEDEENGKEKISAGYFRLIRNYYRFGWVIPYLFGASPVIHSSCLKKSHSNLVFKNMKQDMFYLPYATSLRTSNLGYANQEQSDLEISLNDLRSYLIKLRQALVTPSDRFSKFRKKDGYSYLQLNNSILQTENELYAPIRPKAAANPNESPSSALFRTGVKYIEVRSLDINPFSPIGVNAVQIRFLDLFLIWCALLEAPEINRTELLHACKNWNIVSLEGRKPGQTIDIDCSGRQELLSKVGKFLFNDLYQVAKVLDSNIGDRHYQKACEDLVSAFDNPDLTVSARILRTVMKEGSIGVGLRLAEHYHKIFLKEPLEIISEALFDKEREASLFRQSQIEESDTLSFEAFIKQNYGI